MAITWQLWQHIRTGEVYAVEIERATVIGACGPLDYVEQRADILQHMLYDPELGAEIDARQEQYRLTSPPPQQRTVTQWKWKSLQHWLNHNRPDIGLGTVSGVRGFYKRDLGLDASFVPCGYNWRDVAARLGAVKLRDK